MAFSPCLLWVINGALSVIFFLFPVGITSYLLCYLVLFHVFPCFQNLLCSSLGVLFHLFFIILYGLLPLSHVRAKNTGHYDVHFLAPKLVPFKILGVFILPLFIFLFISFISNNLSYSLILQFTLLICLFMTYIYIYIFIQSTLIIIYL